MSSRDARIGSLGLVMTFVCSWGLAGCAPEEPTAAGPAEPTVAEAALAETGATSLDMERDRVEGDVYHYSVLIRVGGTPNARVRLHRVVRERAAWRPWEGAPAIMLLHGDFSTFTTNFMSSGAAAPPHGGLAVYLAEQGIDVWGLDRRWTTAPTDGADLSDFAGMTYAAEIDDIGRALAFARAASAATGSGAGRMILAGFSRGGHLAYEYAAHETQLPPGERQIRGLVPIDISARISPDDEAAREGACESLASEREALAGGTVDSDNGFVIQVGQRAASAPDDPSPFFDNYTNRDVMLAFMAQTYLFWAPTPTYHLAGGVLADGAPTALRFSSEPVIDGWLAAAPFHQALAESADTDAMWCGEGPLPLADHIRDIDVPLYYLGAAGGFGDHGLYSTTLVASSDVTTHVVRRLGADGTAEDVGHADLLYAADAPDLAWKPLARWILQH